MSASSSTSIPPWVSGRILGFFNRARSVGDLLDGTIVDDPADGPGNAMGPTLAARILRERNTLPSRRFTDIEQVDAIRGVGPNTMKDLVHSLGTSAAEAFVASMYDGVIFRENWTLHFDRTEIEDPEQHDALLHDDEELRAWVVARIEALAKEHEVSAEDRQQMVSQLQSAYIDEYSNSTPAASYALALWLYEHDADNWFTWERIQAETLGYFEHHMDHNPWEMKLRVFKGFEQRGIIRPGITPPDLPVVVNEAERAITLWFSALYD
ncbi:MAG: hypothetical protein AB1Z98_07885 [Nannocystaceae bacterium]